MPGIKINNFSGMIPAQDVRLLPINAAAYAENTWLADGALRGFRPLTLVRTLVDASAKKVFRIPNDFFAKPASDFSSSTWMEFQDADTDVLRSPIVDDLYNRYYWASPSIAPTYNSLARIQAGSAAYTLGVPGPTSLPSVTPSGGASSVTSSRAYVYTWVTGFNEEGVPSAATVATGKEDDTWHITLTAPSGGQSVNRNITNARIYRTVTSSSGVASYFLVTELAIGTTTYNDTLSDTVVSGNAQLESTNWNEPPSSMKGIVALPNGIFAGWSGGNIYFSEPYRPHAWPAIYSLSVDSPVVGMGVHGQSLIVATTGNPVIISGVHPASMSQTKIQTLEPCASRGSLVPTPDGVIYASTSGLVIATAGGVSNISEQFLNKEQWLASVDPYAMRSVQFGRIYLGLHAPRNGAGLGFEFGPRGFEWISDANATKAIQTDVWTGEVFTIHSGNLYHFNPAVLTGMESYLWRSKEFEAPFPENVGAGKIMFTVPDGSPTLTTENTSLVQTLGSNQYGLFRLYADGVLIYTKELRTTGTVFKFPSDRRSNLYQFEVNARVIVRSIEVASSARELRNV